jgi:glycosyltransferase 2 family protein
MKKAIIGIIISLILLLWTLWGIDWSLVRASFMKIRWPYIFPYIFLLLIIQSIRSFRWGLLLRPLRPVGQKVLFPITSIGFLAIAILPARTGELARPYLLSKKEQIPMSAGLATIVVERIMDVITVLIFIILVSFSAELPRWIIGAGYIAMGIIATIFLILLLVIAKEPLVSNIVGRVLRPFPVRISELMQNFITSFSYGARILFHWRMMALAFVFSIILWSTMAFCNYIMFFAFSFSLSIVAAFVLVIIVDLGLMIPAAPGFVGSFQFLFVIGMAIFGVGREQALSFSILSHAVQMLFVAVLGLAFLPMMKIPEFSLRKSQNAEQ